MSAITDSRAKACLTVIRRIAQQKGLSSATIAGKVGVPVDEFRQYFVNGNMPLNMFMSICNGLGTTVTDVLLSARSVLAEESKNNASKTVANQPVSPENKPAVTENKSVPTETTPETTSKVDPWSVVDENADNPFAIPETEDAEPAVNAGTPFTEANSVNGLTTSDRLFVNWSNIIQAAIKTCEVSESLQNNLPKPKTTETDDTINLEFNSEQDLADYSNSGLEAAVDAELVKNNISVKLLKIVAK